MKILDRGASFARRLSVFYLFIFVLLLFFGFFYYKYIPGNQSELDSRGFRILNQLSTNIAQKNDDIDSTLNSFGDSLTWDSVQLEMSKQINKSFHYEIVCQDHLAKKRIYKPIDQYPGSEWVFNYKLEDHPQTGEDCFAIVTMDDFLGPVLATRDDLFDSYILLKKKEDSISAGTDSSKYSKIEVHSAKSAAMTILYLQKNLSASDLINSDSAMALQKNSDQATVTDIQVSGTPYKLFSRPFAIGNEQLVLAGLISKVSYDNKVKSLPVPFISMLLIIILFGFIFLPFIKVFLLSPKENMNRRDVLGTTVSIYAGTSVIVLIGFYLVIYYVTTNTFNDRLSEISGKITAGIEQEFRDADDQLDMYTNLYSSLGDSEKKSLGYIPQDLAIQKRVDEKFTPQLYKNIYRVYWIDSSGQTMAKWNPFDFNAPLSNIKDYKYYKLLQDKTSADSSLVVDAGKSNTTNEFQIYFTKRSSILVDSAGIKQKKCMAIGIAGFLDCSLMPILPAGFGFCIVDNESGDVLVHSDGRRNLSENILRETENNERLHNCLTNKTDAEIAGVNLYGQPHLMRVSPIRGQELSLVTFYETDLFSMNIFRMVHFVGESIVYIFLALALCIFFSTSYTPKPSKLEFRMNPVEWVRPCRKNVLSYSFTYKFYPALIILSLCFIAFIFWIRADVRSIFYISLFIPFYAMWGFLASRRKEKLLFNQAFIPDDKWKLRKKLMKEFFELKEISFLEVIWLSKTTVFFILLLNWVVFRLIANGPFGHNISVPLFVGSFQFVTCLIFVFFYKLTFDEDPKMGGIKFRPISLSASQARRNFSTFYIRSLYYSVLLTAIIPVSGIILYALKSEKIQYCKTDELAIAQSDRARRQYIISSLLPGYKISVREKLEKSGYLDKLMDEKGLYLSGEKLTQGGKPFERDKLPDEPYITMLDDLFLITSGEYNSYSIHLKASDNTWIFSSPDNPKNVLLTRLIDSDRDHPDNPTDMRYKNIQVEADFSGLLYSFSRVSYMLPVFLVLVVFIFLRFGPRFFRMLVNRIFLLDFLPKNFRLDKNNPWLADFFPKGYKPVIGFKIEKKQLAPMEIQELYVLDLTLSNTKPYQMIWDSLKEDERYLLYDFALDSYTNYKDSLTIYRLLQKGVLIYNTNELKFFQPSFRNFILTKKSTDEIERLKNKYSVPGIWQTIRIPALIVIAVSAIFLLLTQENISHRLAGLITSVGAIIPLAMEITKRAATKGT
jgi:hypothetical protein